jgi:hypothetical protein
MIDVRDTECKDVVRNKVGRVRANGGPLWTPQQNVDSHNNTVHVDHTIDNRIFEKELELVHRFKADAITFFTCAHTYTE